MALKFVIAFCCMIKYRYTSCFLLKNMMEGNAARGTFSSFALGNSWETSNGKTLVIVESAKKVQTIQNYLGDDYIVDFCSGHIRDLAKKAQDIPESIRRLKIQEDLKLTVGQLGVNVFDDFAPLYVPVYNKVDIQKRLKEKSKQCSRILLATDGDREGEAISWHLVQVLKPKVPYKRAVFNEITRDAILNSFNNPRDLDMDLVEAQETRRILDRLAGFTLSPILWRCISPGLSAGRVQSCGLHLLTEREAKRWDFVAARYYSVQASLTSGGGDPIVVSAQLVRVNDKKVATSSDFDDRTGELRGTRDDCLVLGMTETQDALRWLSIGSSLDSSNTGTKTSPTAFRVVDKSVRKLSSKAPMPLITSTLQQTASYRMRMSPKRTMLLAQQLYEAGHITYMRTDSPALSSTATEIGRGLVSELFGEEYLASPTSAIRNKQQKSDAPLNAQGAHEAIRPADVNGRFPSPNELELSDELSALYRLIYMHTLASLMAPLQTQITTVKIQASSESLECNEDDDLSSLLGPRSALLKSSRSDVLFDGFTRCLKLINVKSRAPEPPSPAVNRLTVGQELWIDSSAAQMTPGVSLGSSDDLEAGDGVEDNGPYKGVSEGDEDDEGSAETTAGPGTGDVEEGVLVAPGLLGQPHMTSPPARFSEASFIKELEVLGVGRPSTYAKILQILKDRGYINVRGSTMVPTVTGLLVAQVMKRYFPDLVNPGFTARMESSLDAIASGNMNKVKFLQEFYFGSENHEHSSVGLLNKVTSTIRSGMMDLTESRKLNLPYLKDICALKMSSNGIFVEEVLPPPNDVSTTAKSSAAPAGTGTPDESVPTLRRWGLPEELAEDISLITVDAVKAVMQSPVTTQGVVIGIDPESSKQLILGLSRYGKYLQLGSAEDEEKSTHSIPKWVTGSRCSLEDMLSFCKLPRAICQHPSLGSPVMLEVHRGNLTVSVQGYPLKKALPYESLPNAVTAEDALSLLSAEEVLDSQRSLGSCNGTEVLLRRGRFGHYLLHDNVISALHKKNHSTISLDEAVQLLRTRGKPYLKTKGAKAKAKRAKKSVVMKQTEQMSISTEKVELKAADKKLSKTVAASDKKPSDEAPVKAKRGSAYSRFLKARALPLVQGAALWKTMSADEKREFELQESALDTVTCGDVTVKVATDGHRSGHGLDDEASKLAPKPVGRRRSASGVRGKKDVTIV